MSDKIIVISDDFSRYPGGRWKKDGPYSGEKFRESLLCPALVDAAADPRAKVIVDLDGTAGYGSSFLEEAFGGLVRTCNVDRSIIRHRLFIRSNDPLYAGFHTDALRYLKNALDARATVAA